MKKFFIAIMIFTIFLIGATQISFADSKTENTISLNNTARLNTIVKTLLMSKIQEATNKFYEPYLTIQPTVVAYLKDSKITNIEGEISNSKYTVTVEIEPYIGPHISVGRDRITLDITADGMVTVKNFEHIKSYELPPNYKNRYRKTQ